MSVEFIKEGGPIFIGGCARSGTTMLGSQLGAGAGCVATPESQFKAEALSKFGRIPAKDALPEVARYIVAHFRFRLWGVEVPQDPDWGMESQDYGELLLKFVGLYANRVGRSLHARWVDHTPSNRNFVPELFQIFPSAKFIHLVRDGRGVAASLFEVPWGPNSIGRAADFWLQSVAAGLAAELAYPDRVRRVRYEDLVQSPRETLSGLCEWLEVPLSDAMIEGKGLEVPRYTQDQHAKVGKLPDSRGADRWKHALSDREIEIFESRAGGVLDAFGYPRAYGAAAKRSTALETFLGGETRISLKEPLNFARQWLRMRVGR